MSMPTPIHTGLSVQHIVIQQKISSFESDVRRIEGVLRHARTIMDVVRAKNSLPSAPSLISWSPEVRRARTAAEQALKTAAERTVKAAMEQLDELFQGAPDSEFQRALGNFQRDLRYIGPIASNVMRHASVHIHTHYRLRKTEVASGTEGVKLYAVSGANSQTHITEGDLKPGEVLFQKQISAQTKDGGRILAGKRLDNGGILALMIHGGRDSFAVSDESRPLAQQYTFGSLRDCLLEFERRAGVTLPEIRVFEPGFGIWEAHQKYAQSGENPWRLEPGQQYEVTSPGGTNRRFLVNEDSTVTRVDGDCAGYPLYPRDIWGESEWMSLRKVEQGDQPIQRERG